MLATHETADILHRLAQIELLLQRLVATATSNDSSGAANRQRSTGGPRPSGRRVETLEIALHAEGLRSQGRSWKEVFKACRERWPNDHRVKNSEQVRATHRRHYLSRENAD